MFKKFFMLPVSLLLVLAVSGCSFLGPRKQSITVTGQPADAMVVVNGQQMTAPVTMEVLRNKSVNIVVSKKGYGTFTSNTGYTLSPLGVLDVAGGFFFLFPLVGLLSPGAFELEQDHFYYVLSPSQNQ